MEVVLVSKDAPELQRKFANSWGRRFQLASHEGGAYIKEQTVMDEADNMPGTVVYTKKDDKIFRKNDCIFGPGDIYCSLWSLLGLAGLNAETWTPQFSYWKQPKALDGGKKCIRIITFYLFNPSCCLTTSISEVGSLQE
jgi:hypothetical protein